MKRQVEEPVSTEDDRGDVTTTHPAFAGIVAHRVSGYRALYGSEFRHNHFMRVTITTSEHVRGLSHDRYHGSLRPLIEVDMTEAQWAEFISAPNIGTGVPCTIDNLMGDRLPYLPDPTDKREVFTAEARQRLDRGMAEITALKQLIQTQPGISKTAQRAIAAKIAAAERDLGPNIEFVAQTFAEHVETTVSKAKQEIHGHMLRQMTRAGAGLLGMPLAVDVDEDRPAVEAPAPPEAQPKLLGGPDNPEIEQVGAKPGKVRIVKKVRSDAS